MKTYKHVFYPQWRRKIMKEHKVLWLNMLLYCPPLFTDDVGDSPKWKSQEEINRLVALSSRLAEFMWQLFTLT